MNHSMIRSGSLQDPAKAALQIAIRQDGLVFVDGEHVNNIQLVPMLAALNTDRSKPLEIRADRTCPFGAVRAVVSAAQSAGYDRVRFLTGPIALLDTSPAHPRG